MNCFYKNKAILFDLDGTIIESSKGIYNALNYMFGKIGFLDYHQDDLYKFLGPSIAGQLKMGYGFSEETADAAVEIYREYYKTKGIYECYAFSSIKELLIKLKSQGKLIALATKKPEIFAVRIIEYLGLMPYFDAICGAKLEDNDDSKGYIINRAIKELGVKRKNAVMVGDTKYDVIGANDAGIDCIGVLYGFGNKEELTENGATIIVEDVLELTRILTVNQSEEVFFAEMLSYNSEIEYSTAECDSQREVLGVVI